MAKQKAHIASTNCSREEFKFESRWSSLRKRWRLRDASCVRRVSSTGKDELAWLSVLRRSRDTERTFAASRDDSWSLSSRDTHDLHFCNKSICAAMARPPDPAKCCQPLSSDFLGPNCTLIRLLLLQPCNGLTCLFYSV